MANKYKTNDTAYLIESNRIIRKVKIVKISGGLYTIKFGNGGGIKVRETRLFATADDAKAAIEAIPKAKPKPLHYPSPWDWHGE